MSNFQINKTPLDVELNLTGQEPVEGKLHLSDYCENHPGAERLADLLTNEGDFLPFTLKDGRFWLVKKKAIQRVVIDEKFAAEISHSYDLNLMIQNEVQIHLTDGSTLKGQLLIEPLEGASRTQDELNRGRGFILLRCGDRIVLVVTRHVSSVIENRN